MKGNYLLEKENWGEALSQFAKSKYRTFVIGIDRGRTIYDQLGKVGDLDYQELCKQRVEEIEPSIRYCNYNLKGKKVGTSDTSSDALLDMKMESKGAGMDLLQSKLDVSDSFLSLINCSSGHIVRVLEKAGLTDDEIEIDTDVGRIFA
jgi:signal recognition particle subunit SRP68